MLEQEMIRQLEEETQEYLANMKRFSKTFSVTMEVPWAKLHSSMNWACRSVGKPG